ncbi:MAG: PilX N-terminal domain-containing pilus assembly protein [Thermoanaerobaculaceae bacterium]
MRERGAALIFVIVVLLVLTVLGMALALFMGQEDRTSGRQDLQKLALYAAEAGLRRGEGVLRGLKLLQAQGLLSHTSTALQAFQQTPTLPVHPTNSGEYDAQHLGTYLTQDNAELANVEIPLQAQGKRAFYSVYVRNNPDDAGPTTNADSRIRLLAVGWVANNGDPGAPWPARAVATVKILEEEFNWQGQAAAESAQKLGNPGGTSSGGVERFGVPGAGGP